KESLIAESLKCAMEGNLQQLLSCDRSDGALREYLDKYLSRQHRDNPGDGCVMAALACEIARHPGARSLFTDYVKDTLTLMSRKFAPEGGDDREGRAEVLRTLVGVVGAVILARAVDNKSLSDEILARTYENLLRDT